MSMEERVHARVSALIQRGLALYARGELLGAVSEWEHALALEPDCDEAIQHIEYVNENFDLLDERFKLDDDDGVLAELESPFGLAAIDEAGSLPGLEPLELPIWARPAELPSPPSPSDGILSGIDDGWFLIDEASPDLGAEPLDADAFRDEPFDGDLLGADRGEAGPGEHDDGLLSLDEVLPPPEQDDLLRLEGQGIADDPLAGEMPFDLGGEPEYVGGPTRAVGAASLPVARPVAGPTGRPVLAPGELRQRAAASSLPEEQTVDMSGLPSSGLPPPGPARPPVAGSRPSGFPTLPPLRGRVTPPGPAAAQKTDKPERSPIDPMGKPMVNTMICIDDGWTVERGHSGLPWSTSGAGPSAGLDARMTEDVLASDLGIGSAETGSIESAPAKPVAPVVPVVVEELPPQSEPDPEPAAEPELDESSAVPVVLEPSVDLATGPTLDISALGLFDTLAGQPPPPAKPRAPAPATSSATPLAQPPSARKPGPALVDELWHMLSAEVDQGASAAESEDEEHERRMTALFQIAEQAHKRGDLPCAVVALEIAVSDDPDSVLAQKLIQLNRELMCRVYIGYLGDTGAVPSLAVPMSELAQYKLDSRAMFMLSRLDGMMSYAELLDVSGMPAHEALRYLATMLLRGVVK